MKQVSMLFLIAAMASAPMLAAGPGKIKFSESSQLVGEGAGMVNVLVERSNGEDGTVSVQWSTAAGSATAGSDFTASSGTLTWSNNDGSDRVIGIPILDDGAPEGGESFTVTLSNPTGGAVVDSTRGTITITISDNDGGSGGGGGGGGGGGTGGDDGPGDDGPGGGGDDGPGDDGPGGGGDDGGGDDGSGAGRIKFDERTYFSLESGRVAVITVERSQGESGAVSVSWATADGTATEGSDYVGGTGTLSWGPGDGSTKTFTVDIIDDAATEPNETVQLMLFGATGGAVVDSERGTAVLTIVDTAGGGGGGGGGTGGGTGDDTRPGTIKLGSASFQVIESQPMATVTVERSRGEAGAVSVRLSTSDGSAEDGLDYQGVSQVLFWAAGDGATKTVSIPVFEDTLSEGNETINLALSEVTGGAAIDDVRGNGILSIIDNDASTATCVPTATTSCLAGGRFEVEVTWRTPDGQAAAGKVVPQGNNSTLFWFFDQNNVEVLLKVLDACSFSNSYWVFYAATTNVDFSLRVRDTASGLVKEYRNLQGQAAEPIQDTFTFKTCG